jgi:hypothetical protein
MTSAINGVPERLTIAAIAVWLNGIARQRSNHSVLSSGSKGGRTGVMIIIKHSKMTSRANRFLFHQENLIST